MFTEGLKGVEDTVVHTAPPALEERNVLGVESTPVTLLAGWPRLSTRVDSKSGWRAEQEAKRRGGSLKGGQPGRGWSSQVEDILQWEGSQARGGHRWEHNQAKD